jgi:hypothetical protein
MKIGEYRYVTIYTDSTLPDVIFGKYAPRLEINLDIAKELIENRLSFSEGKPMYAVMDFSNVKSVTKEARDFMNCQEGGLKGLLGGAFLSNNVVATLFINLFLKVSPPVIPARFFTDQKEALNWLIKIRSQHHPVPQIIGA